jgi:4-alpha-glucanotransferase
LNKRGSGILLHITSLPSPYGIGDLGTDAFLFTDFLAGTHQSFWQILPLTLTCPDYGNSPYSSFSAFAGNTLLISPERMVISGFLSESDIKDVPEFSRERVDYDSVRKFKENIFNTAFEKNRKNLDSHQDFQKFCSESAGWLYDYTLFVAIKNRLNGADWSQWPVELRDRHESALHKMAEMLRSSILKEQFLQYIFYTQWHSLKNYCDSKNIKIIGDIPIYVNYDSADVWADPEIFNLDKEKKPVFVAGVPPDYFSTTGQLWGHPVYNWDVLGKSHYSWWIKRIKRNLKLFHMFRLDHFRGFVAYWQIPSSEQNAIKGKWVEAPAEDFFNTLLQKFPDISIIAEDLGVITPDVKDTIDKFGFPGMKVLLFAFGEDLPSNPYAPHNHIRNCIVYTGTHDNNTIAGWYSSELTLKDKKRISAYAGHEITEKTIHWEMIRLAMMSVADTVIIPMQDILGLGENYRMNRPAHPDGNWEWRLLREQMSDSLIHKLRNLTQLFGRGES